MKRRTGSRREGHEEGNQLIETGRMEILPKARKGRRRREALAGLRAGAGGRERQSEMSSGVGRKLQMWRGVPRGRCNRAFREQPAVNGNDLVRSGL